MTFYQNLEPLEQFELVAMVSSACVVLAVVLRELFADREIQLAARALGLIGFVLLGSFGWRMAAKCERLEPSVHEHDESIRHHVYAVK
jgi:hypothetical protein